MAHSATKKTILKGARFIRGSIGDSPKVLFAQDVKVRRNLKDMSFFYSAVLVFIAVFAFISSVLWSRLMVVNIGYEISRANSARTVLIEKNKRLTLDYMALKSPERIEKIASRELGLVYPTGAQVVNIR